MQRDQDLRIIHRRYVNFAQGTTILVTGPAHPQTSSDIVEGGDHFILELYKSD